MRSALDAAIKADNGATDYNGAFAKSDADNPGADARVFLTDGGHDVGTYNEAHLVHKVPTYVIGFGSGIAAGRRPGAAEKNRQRHRRQVLPGEGHERAAGGDEQHRRGAHLPDAAAPVHRHARNRARAKSHKITVGAATKTLQITLTWASPLDKFKLSGLRLVGKDGLLAVASRKPGKLKVTKTVSSTFAIVKVSKLRKGTLRFNVKAAKVGSGAPKATLTTQVGQSTHK